MRDKECTAGDEAGTTVQRRAAGLIGSYHLHVTLNGNSFDADDSSPGDGLTLLFKAWLDAQHPITQDDLDALVAGRERTATKLETLRDTLRVIAKPWKKRT